MTGATLISIGNVTVFAPAFAIAIVHNTIDCSTVNVLLKLFRLSPPRFALASKVVTFGPPQTYNALGGPNLPA